MTTKDDLDNWFTYHPPVNDAQIDTYRTLRDGAKTFASLILDLTPSCPDQSAAIRKVREAVMTANAAIACGNNPTP